MNKALEKRQEKYKGLLLDELKNTPIVQIACNKAGVGRATYYRWRKEDPSFAGQADETLGEGVLLINDVAESQLIYAIKDKNLGAIIFWLKSHHPAYKTKMEVKGSTTYSDNEIIELTSLLYNPETFKRGQELLTSYVIKGKISESYAELILRIFLAQMKIENIMIRKTEAELMSEVLFRDKINKRLKK